MKNITDRLLLRKALGTLVPFVLFFRNIYILYYGEIGWAPILGNLK